MAVRIVRLGSARVEGEGVRIGTVRRPPRGVRKEEYAKRDFYDVWLPQLAPSAELLAFAKAAAGSDAGWKRFERQFRRELAAPDAARVLDLLIALSRSADFSIGCFCEDESRCHRSILREVLAERGALIR